MFADCLYLPWRRLAEHPKAAAALIKVVGTKGGAVGCQAIETDRSEVCRQCRTVNMRTDHQRTAEICFPSKQNRGICKHVPAGHRELIFRSIFICSIFILTHMFSETIIIIHRRKSVPQRK